MRLLFTDPCVFPLPAMAGSSFPDNKSLPGGEYAADYLVLNDALQCLAPYFRPLVNDGASG